MVQFPYAPAGDLRELGDDVRELFADLEATLPVDQRVYSGECNPLLDVLETANGVEIIVDVTGVPTEAIRILFRNGVVLVVGEKAPTRTNVSATYHLVEREFGRFARAIRLSGAFEVGAGRAWLDGGELTIVIPRRADRRGQGHVIPIVADGHGPA